MKKLIGKFYNFHLFGLIFILVISLPIMGGCDLSERLTDYGVEIEITGLEEEEVEQLKVLVDDVTVDEFTYEDGIVRGEAGGLRGSVKIEPILENREFYPELIEIDSSDDGRIINFNAVKETHVFSDLQSKVDEALPGDKLILDNEDFDNIEIKTAGLTLVSNYDLEDTETSIAGIIISADDVTIDEFIIPEGSNIEIDSSDNVKLKNNRISGSNNITGIFINNSEVSLENNIIRDKSIGLEARSGSSLNLKDEIIRDSGDTGIKLSGSSASVENTVIQDNENGFYITDESDLNLKESIINNKETGIFAQNSSLEIIDSEVLRNINAVELDDSLGLELRNSEINNNNSGVKITGGSASISKTDFIGNDYALELNSMSEVEISESRVNNNDYGIELNYSSRDIQIKNNEISFNDHYGLKMQSISGKVTENEIISNRDGIIHQQGGRLLVKNNNIEGNSHNGLRVEEAEAVVELNNIIYNDLNGGQFIGETAVRESRVNENNISDNNIGLYVSVEEAGIELNAEHNWWGTDDLEAIEEMVQGPVRYRPIREEEPPEVGP